MIENPTDEQLKTLRMIIYCITNILNNKKYIGKSKKSFFSRYASYKWWLYIDNKLLQRAIKKYGYENFKVSIIEYNIPNPVELSDKEIMYIKETYKTIFPNGYNFDPTKDYGRIGKEYVFYDHLLDKEIKITNLEEFCRINDLHPGCMNGLFHKRGPRIRHKHYTLPGIKIKKWRTLSPDGIEYLIFQGESVNFCKKHNLDYRSFSNLLRGSCKSSQGWICLNYGLKPKEFSLKSPEGKIITLKDRDISKFCRENKLSLTCISNVLHNRNKNHKGWTLPDYEVEFYEFIDINGNLIKIPKFLGRLKEFCETNNLNYRSVLLLVSGKIKTSSGWKINDH